MGRIALVARPTAGNAELTGRPCTGMGESKMSASESSSSPGMSVMSVLSGK